MNAHVAAPIDRRAERVHLFLVATLYFGRMSNPVRVRNLSATGALVEGASLPQFGETVILRRGALEAHGTVIWSGSGKAGLKFSGLVEVADWLPVKAATRQTQVDQVAFGMKHGGGAVDAVAVPAVHHNLSMASVVVDLEVLQAQLGQLGDKLAEDEFLLASHPEVQFLDAAGQRIGRIVEALRTAPR